MHTYCRQAVLGQPACKESVLDLKPEKPSAQYCAVDSADTLSNSQTCETAGKDVSELSNNGVKHVGWLRAGNMRQPVAVLADGQLFIYRENGESPNCRLSSGTSAFTSRQCTHMMHFGRTNAHCLQAEDSTVCSRIRFCWQTCLSRTCSGCRSLLRI